MRQTLEHRVAPVEARYKQIAPKLEQVESLAARGVVPATPTPTPSPTPTVTPTAPPPVRVGSTFQVNTYTTGSQTNPAIGCDGDGDFVVAWSSALQDGSASGVFARRFDAAGAHQGTEFQVNSYTPGAQSSPAVALDGNGDFVVVWGSSGQDGSFSGTFAQRFSSSGATQGAEFQVNSHTTFSQDGSDVARDSDGDFVVVWHSGHQDGANAIGYNHGVFGRRFNAAGAAQAVEFQINSYTTDSQYEATVATDSDGDFVVAWQSIYQDGSSFGVFARRFDSAGMPQGVEFQVHSYTSGTQAAPALAMDSDGDFVVVWQSNGQDGSFYDIFGRRFDASGIAQGAEFQVNSYTYGNQRSPAVAMTSGGAFVVTWRSSLALDGIFGQAFDAAGAPQGPMFGVSSFMFYPTAPVLCMDSAGDFVVVWHSTNQDGSSEGIFGQLFAGGEPLLDVDANGSIGPLTDGLLILRYLFGFTGATLTTGALGGGCSRCTAGDIQTYLDSITAQLDVDGDGSAEPLTDGLLILRYLFGFTGATLTTGAVDLANCTRCTAETITAYLDGLAS